MQDDRTQIRRTRIGRRAALAMGAAAGVFPGLVPAWGEQPPEPGEPLLFSLPLPLTGPVAYTGGMMLRAWHDALDWLNKGGGIRGHRIDAQIYDDQYNVDMAVAGFKQAMAKGNVVFAGVDGTNAIRAIAPMDNQQYKVLTGNLGNTSDQVDTSKYPYNLLTMPNYSDMFDIVLTYIKGKQPGAKLAFIYSDTEFGRDPIAFGHKRAAELGLPIVMEDQTKFTAMDVTPSAIKLRNTAPDYVIMHGYAANIWPEIVKLAREYRVKSQFIVTIVAADPDLIKGVGDAGDGILGVVPFNLIVKGNDQPVMKVIDTYLKAWTDKPKPYVGYANIGYLMPWSQAVALKAILETAIDQKLPLTGDNLVKVANGIQALDMGGLCGPNPVSFVQNRIPYGIIFRFTVKPNDFSLAPETGFIKVA